MYIFMFDVTNLEIQWRLQASAVLQSVRINILFGPLYVRILYNLAMWCVVHSCMCAATSLEVAVLQARDGMKYMMFTFKIYVKEMIKEWWPVSKWRGSFRVPRINPECETVLKLGRQVKMMIWIESIKFLKSSGEGKNSSKILVYIQF